MKKKCLVSLCFMFQCQSFVCRHTNKNFYLKVILQQVKIYSLALNISFEFFECHTIPSDWPEGLENQFVSS